MKYFSINDQILEAIDDYHVKSLAMQNYLYDGNPNNLDLQKLQKEVNDDLIFHVPIYDMLDRRYAAFCSFLEAIDKKENDPKKNGLHFLEAPSLSDLEIEDALALFYLFRLCGSGINYVPNTTGNPFGTHGFGNFWIVESWLKGDLKLDDWLLDLEVRETPFTNNKGYLLPQVSYKHLTSGHLKNFILTEIRGIVSKMQDLLGNGRIGIIDFVDSMNVYLVSKGFKRQNFVLSATAADIAEYFPNLIDQKSSIYAGTNAKKCISAMFNKKPGIKQLDFEIEAINFIAERYNSVPYSVEDSRMCDVYRYLYEFQSKDHIAKNGGKTYANNSTIKQYCDLSGEDYSEYIKKLLN